MKLYTHFLEKPQTTDIKKYRFRQNCDVFVILFYLLILHLRHYVIIIHKKRNRSG